MGTHHAGGRTVQDLSLFARQLAEESMAWMDAFWDGGSGLLAIGSDRAIAKRDTRSTVRYALGLLLRDGPGDSERACRALDTVLHMQYDEPGSALHGAFRSWAGQPHPGSAPTAFEFDPNHRQFMGTLFAVLLDEYSTRLTAGLVRRMDVAILRMVAGEPSHRCLPVYANISLMQAGLLTWAGARYNREDWVTRGEALAREIYQLFVGHGAFEEYNSPTYYGVDLFALALWRRYARSDSLAQWGAEIESSLWRDASRYYHAGLRNMCGPFSRSYGMDMTAYCALLGMCIWSAIGRRLAPFPPKVEGVFDHCGDYCWGPILAILDPDIPPDVVPRFQAFSGERLIEKRISTIPDRVATAWLSASIMIGAEATPLDAGEQTFYRLRKDFEEFDPASRHWKDPHLATRRCITLSRDFCPATIHWRQPEGQIGWIRLQYLGAVCARASARRLQIAGHHEIELAERFGEEHSCFVFRIGVSLARAAMELDCWRLPGLTIRIDGNLGRPVVRADGAQTIVTFTPKTRWPEVQLEVCP